VLARPTHFYASLLWTATIYSRVLGSVGVIVSRGRLRAFWVGYVVFGWTHVYIALLPLNKLLSREYLNFPMYLLNLLAGWLGRDANYISGDYA